jgi:N-methylhydantoinase A
MLPLFAAAICAELGISQIVVPDNSSAFSAYGVLMADYVRQYEHTVRWNLDETERYGEVNGIAAQLKATAVSDAAREGIPEEELQIEHSGSFRFAAQTYEVAVPLSGSDLTSEDARRLAREFPGHYEASYGKGTAWKGSPVLMVDYVIKVTSRREKPANSTNGSGPAGDRASDPELERGIFLPGDRASRSLPVYAERSLPPGAGLEGPCIIDMGDTTVYVPATAECRRDEFRNFVLTLQEVE